MSFWTTSDKSENLQQNNGTFDAGGGDMDPIPADTQVLKRHARKPSGTVMKVTNTSILSGPY